MVGDSRDDILCGRGAGGVTVLVGWNGGETWGADFAVGTLLDAVEALSGGFEVVRGQDPGNMTL